MLLVYRSAISRCDVSFAWSTVAYVLSFAGVSVLASTRTCHIAASKYAVVVCCQVHAYTACPNNQTAYLAELKSGKEVLVVDGEGRQRSAIIGRVKIETRPLVSELLCRALCLLCLLVYARNAPNIKTLHMQC